MKHLNFVICGTGYRGSGLSKKVICELEDVSIIGVCDVYEDKAESLANALVEKTGTRPVVYTDTQKMFRELKPDAALVSTSWKTHIQVAIQAMECGVAVAMEVGGAYSEEECRALVDTQRRTGVPFMFMENCCYNKDELLATSLARNGLFGRMVYCHGSYAHDLRREVAYGDRNRHYRLEEYSTRNRENYPTHELGPIARLLDINRGNRMVSLVSSASGAFGLHDYVQQKPELAYLHDREFPQADIVETLITCENGELISLRLDTTLPHFYSREFTVRGTRGMYNQDNNMVFLDGEKETFDTVATIREMNNNAEQYSDYLPDIWRDIDEETRKKGHGGMDYFEFVEFVKALREGTEMPIDVYDAASWMSIAYLSEQSIALGGASVPVPDFTDGAYKSRENRDVLPLPKINN